MGPFDLLDRNRNLALMGERPLCAESGRCKAAKLGRFLRRARSIPDSQHYEGRCLEHLIILPSIVYERSQDNKKTLHKRDC